MSRRRTCCCGGGEGDVCFSFAVTAKHLQNCTLTCATVPCTVYLDETCPVADSFGVTNTYTKAVGTIQPQQLVTSRDGGPCSCGIPCVYTWTPPETEWDTSICFKMNNLGTQCFACPEIIDQYPPAGDLNNTITILKGPSLVCPQVCGCCGTGTLFVSIEYQRLMPPSTIQGDCGSVTIGGSFGNPYNWMTNYRVQYCWDISYPCTMTLFRIFAGSNAYFPPSYGPGVFGTSDCDCNNNTNNGCDTSVTGSNCYPMTGDWATIYAAAGSPPVTLNCGSCKC